MNFSNCSGVRLLCEAGSSPHTRSLLGFTALESAGCRGSSAAMQELVSIAGHTLDFTGALWSACALKGEGGSANIVQWLLDLRADVDKPKDPWEHSGMYGLLVASKALQHRFGTQTKATRQFYHVKGATPLVMALLESQYEGAAVLIAAGARLDVPNARGCSAADLISDQSAPDFLLQALEGNLEECKRVSIMAQCQGGTTRSF